MGTIDYQNILEEFIIIHDVLSQFDYKLDADEQENSVMAYLTFTNIMFDIRLIEKDFIEYLTDNSIDYINANVTMTSDGKEIVLDLIHPINDITENVMKIQKPDADAFTNINGETADCSVCGQTEIVMADHICMTPVIEEDNIITTIKEFKKYLNK